MKKFFIIAGEASGDLLGSKLIKELKLQNPDSQFIGVGGKLMQEQGLRSIFAMEELSVMGFLEVVPHLFKLLKRIDQTAKIIMAQQPDFIITIDSPDFCFRVMKKLKNFSSAKKVHLIAPSVWAYRASRAKKIAQLYDLLLAILPFEPPYFEKYGLKTVFIGNPIIENAPDFSKKEFLRSQFRQQYNISNNSTLLILTPGSRNSEVTKIFPEFIDAVNLLATTKSDVKVIIPLIDKTRNLVTQMAKNLKVEYFLIEKEQKDSAFFAADFALAKSGTNTLEISLYRLPMIIGYKVNFLTHFILKRMVKIKFANLINLISNQEIIPEMLQKKCRADLIFLELKKLIADKNLAQKQIDQSQIALKIMGLGALQSATNKAVKEILS
ncbi:MAG: lipid-A-disaccharide synthase [Rickettsiales bacterium]|nr:lipid-A-disaccharide synthase [Rickettsiales bacterium]